MKKWLPVLSAFIFSVLQMNAQQRDFKVSEATNNLPWHSMDISEIFKEAELREKMRKEGLTEAVIDKLIESRKKLEAQGRHVQQSGYSKSGVNPVPNALCSDMGVENGWSTWMGATGSNIISGNPAALGTPTVPVTPQFNITSGNGIDPCTPGANPGDPTIPVVAPGFGNASIQLGQAQTPGGVVEQLTFPLTVSALDTDFVYSYALVLYDAGGSHAPTESPFAEFLILDMNGDTVPSSYMYYIAGASSPGFYQANSSCSGGSSTWYKPWTTVCMDLAAYVGQTLYIVITNGDCIHGGHYAHSYWDFSCGSTYNTVPVCNSQMTTLCAPGSGGPGSPYTYQWYQNGTAVSAGTSQCFSIMPQQSDTLSVQIANVTSGCDFTINYVLQDTCLVGATGEENLFDGLYIFPNPTSENLFFDFKDKNFGEAEVIVSNILGERVFGKTIPASGKQVLDVSEFSNGLYFVKIKTGDGAVTKKIIISR